MAYYPQPWIPLITRRRFFLSLSVRNEIVSWISTFRPNIMLLSMFKGNFIRSIICCSSSSMRIPSGLPLKRVLSSSVRPSYSYFSFTLIWNFIDSSCFWSCWQQHIINWSSRSSLAMVPSMKSSASTSSSLQSSSAHAKLFFSSCLLSN